MSNTFIISDHHFGQSSILDFTINNSEEKLRPEFHSVEEMDAIMIERHNAVVNAQDRVYFLGDLCSHNRILDRVMPQMKGRKVLVKGNHDQLKVSQYMKYFDDIRAFDRLDTFVVCHVPIHPNSINHKITANIHGHLHKYRVTKTIMKMEHGAPSFFDIPDERYYNVCVENHNYTPVEFETIRKYFKDKT